MIITASRAADLRGVIGSSITLEVREEGALRACVAVAARMSQMRRCGAPVINSRASSECHRTGHLVRGSTQTQNSGICVFYFINFDSYAPARLTRFLFFAFSCNLF